MVTVAIFVIVGFIVGAYVFRGDTVDSIFGGLFGVLFAGAVGVLVSVGLGYATGEDKTYTFTTEEFVASGFASDDATTVVISNSSRNDIVVTARVLEESIWFIPGHDTKTIIYYTD